MARKSKSQEQTLSGSPSGGFTNFSAKPIQANRGPTPQDTGFAIGQLWVDISNNIIYGLSSVSAGTANWEVLSGGAAPGSVGQETLVAGAAFISNTNIESIDRIFVTRSALNSSPAIGFLVTVVMPGSGFRVDSLDSSGLIIPIDVSSFDFLIVREN